ncbi:hypothetical protein INQ28_30740, partial [Escherichia coli]|nr:hypothetical protein [Escherichia coli]
AAVILMLFGPLSSVVSVYELFVRSDFTLVGSSGQFWISTFATFASTIVQGGVLLVLLSIDERLQGEKV